MSTHRMVSDSFWTDTYIADLDPTEKLLFLYLLTNPLCNIAGIYQIQIRRIAFETGIDSDMVEKLLRRLVKDGKILIYNDWILLINHAKHQAYKNPNVTEGIKRIVEALPRPVKALKGFERLSHLTLLNLTKPNIASDDAKDMGWKKYNENQHTEDVPAIDIDSGEEIKDKEAESREKERLLMEWAEKQRGKKFMDRPTQLSFIKRLKSADISPATIKRTYLDLLQSEYWQEQLRLKQQLPDFKTVFSNLKNKHERSDD